jgi:2-keto-3-deoxy-L-rhamnonate aldolase RhmA
MTGAELRAAMRAGKTVYGTMVTLIKGPRWGALLGRIGFDYVIIDTEHTPYGRDEVADLAATLRSAGIAPIVRIPFPDGHQARMAVDAGAHGFLAPYVETAEEVREVVAAARLRPLKGAALERASREGVYASDEVRPYLEDRFNQNHVVIIGIESQAAIDNLNAILAVPGIDAIFIGPHDLTISLGIPEQYDHPRFQEAVRHIITTSQARGLPAGGHWQHLEQVRQWQAEGSRFILYSSDGRALYEGYRRDLQIIKAGADGGDLVHDV